MSKILIVYDSRSGNTAKMAEEIAEGVKQSGAEVEIKRPDEAKPGKRVGDLVQRLGG
jgi:flavodoxin